MPIQLDSKEKGDPYRPSNGTEGDFFMAKFCHRCALHTTDNRFGYCEEGIKGRALMHYVEDDEYPEEWQFDENGEPTCTAFKSRED